MGALVAGYDLGALVLCFVAIALLLIAKNLVEQGVSVLNIGIFGTHPFGGIARAMENTVLHGLNEAIKGTEKAAAKFESGLIEAMTLLIGIPLLLGFAVYKAFQYLWNHALVPLVHSITDAISTRATQALSKVTALEGTVETDLGLAKRYADGAASGALSGAKAYADKWIDNAVHVLNGNIDAAVTEAEAFASTAIGKLRAAEDSAIATVAGLAAQAEHAGVNAAASALATAERELAAARAEALTAAGGALTAAEDFAARQAARVEAEAFAAAAGVEAAATGALDVVRSIAVGAENELKDLEGIYGALGTATLIASIPAIATLVHAIAIESGLENQSCRSKVKDVCATDPSQWGNLLAGLAVVGFAFNFRELYKVAEELVGDLAPIIKQAA